MFERLHILFADTFMRLKDEGGDCWFMLKLSAPCKLLAELYDKFIREGVDPIESISEDKKRFYFDISKKYYSDTANQIKASKAAYVLELITSTF